jgi:hypothetical protein
MNDVEDWKKKFEKFSGMDKLQEGRKKFQNELAWAIVTQHENVSHCFRLSPSVNTFY